MGRRFVEPLETRALLASAHFAVIGDFGNNSANEAAVATLVKGWNPDFIVTVGDNSYQDASALVIDDNIGQYYHDYIYNYTGDYGAGSPTRRFYPAMGNHDWGGGHVNDYLDYFDLPGNERYYDFAQGPVHFFLVDSDVNEPDGNSATSAQAMWLKGALAAATEPHKLVLFHHAAYSSGSHGSQLSMRWPFAKWGATAVFMGHEHHYERLSEEGIPYFIDGLGGASISALQTPVTGSEFRYNADYGAMLIDADDASMQFKFYNKSGALIDSYTLDSSTRKTLVGAGSGWHYKDDGQDHGTSWRTVGGIDPWPTGEAQLGYGDGDEATVVASGPSSNKFVTTYFRKSFDVANPGAITSLNLSLLRDDGAVVYLNGTEVFRSNMPTGTINYLTHALSAPSTADESNYFSTSVNPALLVAGTNVLAVEIHQVNATSSDISFDLALVAGGDFAPPKVNSSAFQYRFAPMSLAVAFSESVAASLSASDLVLENLTTSTVIPAGQIHVDWNGGDNSAAFTFPNLPNNGSLPDGRYRATLSGQDIADAAGNKMAGAFAAEFFVFSGDANHDAKVDISDLHALAMHWGQPSNYDSEAGDFNYDGVVDGADLTILASKWQVTLAPQPLSLPVSLGRPIRRVATRPASLLSV